MLQDSIDFSFAELRCPRCNSKMTIETVQVAEDMNIVKKCKSGHKLFVLVMNPEYTYNIQRRKKRK